MEAQAVNSNTSTAYSAADFVVTPVTRLPVKRSRVILPDTEGEWADAVVERLNELLALAKGWDGYGAPPVSLRNAIFAIRMLETVCPRDCTPPQIVPGSSGDLQIEWHTAREDIELHVHAPRKVTAWRHIAHGNGDGEEIYLDRDFTIVADWIEDMESHLAPNAAAA